MSEHRGGSTASMANAVEGAATMWMTKGAGLSARFSTRQCRTECHEQRR